MEAARNAPVEAWQYLSSMIPSERELHFGGTESKWKKELLMGNAVCKLLVDWTQQAPYLDVLGQDCSEHDHQVANPISTTSINASTMALLTMEKRAQAAYRTYKDKLPTSIWHCCSRFCFTSIAIDPDKVFLFEELRLIHEVAERSMKKLRMSLTSLRQGERGAAVLTLVFVRLRGVRGRLIPQQTGSADCVSSQDLS